MKSCDFRGRESHVTGTGLGLKAARMGVFSSSMRLSKSSVVVVKEEGWGRESWRCSEGLLWWFLACEGLRLLDIWLWN